MAKSGEIILHVGKFGITSTLVQQAKEMIKKHDEIKIKFSPGSMASGKDAVAQELAEKCNAKLVKRVGFTAILSKKTGKKVEKFRR